MKGIIRNGIRQITPPLLWSALSSLKKRITGAVGDQVQRYFGLQDLDKKLEKYLDFDRGFFVEVGGWDGITHSNSLYFERFRKWRGILVEPSPSEFIKCRKNRPDSQVFCYACVPFDYQDHFVPMLFCASMTVTNLPEERGMAIDPRAHVEDGRKFLAEGEEVFEFGAVAKPLTAILTEASAPKTLDLLILDVEGFELSVLRGLDFGLHAPRFICVEAWNLNDLAEFLGTRNYEYIGQLTKHDHLFRQRGRHSRKTA